MSTFMKRLIAGMGLMALFFTLMYLGHQALSWLMVLLQTVGFRELVNLRYKQAKERKMPLFRTLQWAWFVTAMLGSYGATWLRAPMGTRQVVAWLSAELPDFVTDVHFALDFAVFALYSGVFMATVLTLRPGMYEYQLTQLSWTILVCVMLVVQMKTAIFLVYQGLFWIVFPLSLVICNDTSAYFAGKAFGGRFTKRTFMALSPKKTWEGFVGAYIATTLYAFFAPALFTSFAWVRCSYPELVGKSTAEVQALDPIGSCRLDWFHTPSEMTWFGLAPIQLYNIAAAAFASIVAPFGGFFASAVKRACKIKDYDSIIPGHGGVMDRFDCYPIMICSSWVFFTTFVAAPSLSYTYEEVAKHAATLSSEEIQRLVDHLVEKIAGNGV